MTEGSAATGWAVWLLGRMQQAGLPKNRDLARASGVSDSVISRWLRDGALPTVPQLRMLTGPLRTSLLDLMVAAGHLTRQEADGGSAADGPADPLLGLDEDLRRLASNTLRGARAVQQARSRARLPRDGQPRLGPAPDPAASATTPAAPEAGPYAPGVR